MAIREPFARDNLEKMAQRGRLAFGRCHQVW